jgi:hypothetical protein
MSLNNTQELAENVEKILLIAKTLRTPRTQREIGWRITVIAVSYNSI